MYKNRVLEYCQKNKVDFLKFDTKKVGGEDHSPLWKSKVEFSNIVFEGEISKNKIDAEQSVCKKILESLECHSINLIEKQSINLPIKKFTLTKNIVLIVDLENNFNYENMENIHTTYENLHMIGICSRNLNLKKEPTYEKIVVKSIAKDSADIAIIVFIMTLMKPKQFDEIILLTRDHFGKTLEEISNDGIEDFIFPISITHVMNDIEVHNFLEKYVS